MKRPFYLNPKQRREVAPYRSFFELSIAEDLNARAVPFQYEQIKFKYTEPVKTRTYTPDFGITSKSGKQILIEAKGYFTAENRKTAILVRECNPEADIRFVFQKPGLKINPGAKQNCGQWATRNGFLWAARVVPEEWLKE